MKNRITDFSKVSLLLVLLLASPVKATEQYERVPGTTKSTVQVLPSGSVDYSIPIVVPQGTNGVAPNISLNYRNQSPDGVLGKGWSLSGMGAITRCGATERLDGYQSGISFTNSDRFCLNQNRLVLVDGTYGDGKAEYRTELNTNQKITTRGNVSWGDDDASTAPRRFIVQNPDGRTFHYGSTDDSRIELQNSDIVHFWALSKVEDQLGNYIEFEYFEDKASGQFYPVKIHYTGNEQQNLAPYNSIEFLYEGRSDPFYSCTQGSLLQTAVKLKEIVANKLMLANSEGSEEGEAGEEGEEGEEGEGPQDELVPFRRYLLSYGETNENDFRVVPNNACNALTLEENAQISPYQEILNSRYKANSSRVDRLARYEYLQQVMGVTHVDPQYVQISELLESYFNRSSDRSSGVYQTVLDQLDELSADFTELAIDTATEYDSLSVEQQQDYLADLRAEVSQLESDVAAGRSARRTDLENKKNILVAAQRKIEDELATYLKAQVDKAHRIIMVPMGSPYKSRMMEAFKDDLKLKYRAATRAADECLAFAQSSDTNEKLDEDTSLEEADDDPQTEPCHHDDVNDAFDAFVHYGEGAAIYYGLYNELSTLTESPGANAQGYPIEALVERSKTNHYYHLLVAGQVVNLYERFARQLYRDTLWQLDDGIAAIDDKLLHFDNQLELLAGEHVTDEELELRDKQFQLGLIESGQSVESYVANYMGNIATALSDLQAGQDIGHIAAVTDASTRVNNVFEQLRLIQFQGQEETLVNYQGILDSLLHGQGAILSERSDGQGNSILGDTRLLSVMECGSDDSCFSPVVFNWSEESIGWDAQAAADSVPDYLLSYDKVRAGNEGLTIDTGDISGTDGDGDAPTLTDEQIELGRELAAAGKLIDVNGDGFADWVLAYRRGDGSEYRGTWLNNGAGWSYSPEYTLPALISMAGDVPLGHFVDLNGDGYQDWIGNAWLGNGESIISTLINTHSGWETSSEHLLPRHSILVGENAFTEAGQYFHAVDGSVRWMAGAIDSENRPIWKLDFGGWSQESSNQLPFPTEFDSTLGGAGQRADLDGDGAHEWIEYVEVDGLKSLRVWQYQDNIWSENTSLSIANVHSFAHGQFIDINGDSRLDWVVSTNSEEGMPVQRTLVQDDTGWLQDAMPHFPTLRDASGNQTAYLHDLNGDGTPEWIQGLRAVDASESIASMRLQEGVWVTNTQHQLPFSVSEYNTEDDFQELGEFATLLGTASIDWLNLTHIWSTDNNAEVADNALVSDAGSWQGNADFRLPVLEDRWIDQLSEILAQVEDGESVLAAEQNIVSAVEESNSSSDSSDSSDLALEVTVEADDANGVKTGSLIDVDGDGRLDWVKSVRFSAGVQQKVVWLRDYDGWKRSETFVPPTPLVDFTQRANTKIVDMDADGLPDFLRSIKTGDSIRNELWKNTGTNWQYDSSFTMPRTLHTGAESGVFQSAILLDLNRDGRLDVLADGSDGEPKGAWLNSDAGFITTSAYSPTFSFSSVVEGNRILNGQFVDLNQDGLIDWIEYTNVNDVVHINNGSGWQIDPSYQLPISMRNADGERQALLVDLNNDGYQDLALSYLATDGSELRNSWRNTGNGWQVDQGTDYHLPGTLFYQGHGMVAHLADLNGDGYTDFLQSIEGGHQVTNNRVLWLGSKQGFSLYSSDTAIPALLQRVEVDKLITEYVLADANGDLEMDFVRSSEGANFSNDVFLGLYSVSATIDKLYDGTRRSHISYEKGFKPFVVHPTEERASYPLQSTNGPGVVVSAFRSFAAQSLEETDNESIISDIAYSYSGYAINLKRAGSAGFANAESMDWIAERVTASEFAQDFPHAGRPKQSELNHLWGNTISRTAFSYEAKTNDILSDEVVHSYLARTLVSNFKEDGEPLNTIDTQYLEPHAEYFMPSVELRVLYEGGVEYYTRTSHAYTPDDRLWILGQYSGVEVQNWNSRNTSPQIIKSTRTYNSEGLLETETSSGVTQRNEYDAYGNVTASIAGEGSGIAVRRADFDYDDMGRYRVESKNVAREITQYEFSGITDSPTLIRVNDSSFSTYDYDGFGRKTRETMNEETIRPYDIKFCEELTSTDNIRGCPSGAKYLTAQFSNEEKGSAAETVYYDSLGRELRRATSNADNLLYIDTEYTIQGKVQSRSIPYEPGEDTEIQLVKFVYDSYGRIVSQEEPGNIFRLWLYDGRAVTEYDPLGNATTTIKTHFGAPKTIVDADGNETNYHYNALAQLVKTVDAHGNEINVKYDDGGNKEEVDDPDHGLTHFTYNIFGEVTSKTDALGNKQSFIYDEYGRLESRTDTGFDAEGNAVPEVTATWEYYELDEAKQAYETYISDLTDREVPEEDIAKLNELVYLNPDAASAQVKRVSDTNGYVSESTYDYRARPIENTITLPNSDESRTLATSYLGESQLPYTVHYPNNFSVRYEYDEFGYLTGVKNGGLNTRDHYFGLIERAEFLQDEVSEKIWERAEDVLENVVKPRLDTYDREIRRAERAEDKAVLAASKIDTLTDQVYDDHHAIEHLRGQLHNVTAQTERDERDAVVTNLLNEYSSGSLSINSSAGCGGPRTYTFKVPAYDITREVHDPNASPISVQVPIYDDEDGSARRRIIGYKTETRPPEPEIVVDQHVPEHFIDRLLPEVCVPNVYTGYPHVPANKLHRKREFQVVDHIIGLMTKLRERRRTNERTIEDNIEIFAKQSEIARKLYEQANDYYVNHIESYVEQVNDLNKAGNEVSVKAYEIFIKAGRVYQFFELEQEISFWQVEETDEVNRIVQERYGNNVVNQRSFDPLTGSLRSIKAQAEHEEYAYQNETYWYDPAGNLVYKAHNAMGTTEAYDYDRLNRLKEVDYTFYSEESQTKVTQAFAYDAIGNIKSKTGVGDYQYHADIPHAVETAGDRSYAYDDIGRMHSGDGSTFAYTTFSKPSRIDDGNGDYAEFAYGPTHDRYYQKRVSEQLIEEVPQTVTQETYYYFKGLYEESITDGEITQHASISARGKNIAVVQGYNEVFTPADAIPDLGAAAALTDQLHADLDNTDSLLASYFSALDGVLNSRELVAETSEEDMVLVADMTDCYEVEEDEDSDEGEEGGEEGEGGEGEGEEGDDEESEDDEEEDPKRLHCLSPEQADEVKEIVAASLINIQYYHYDALDSVKAITDAEGVLVSLNYFDAFGNAIIRPETEEGEEIEGDVAFGGHEAIVGMDLVHMNGRIYDPVIGRFLSADPFVPGFTNPQALNRYSYVYNNPLKYVDPSGYKPVTASQHDRNVYINVSLAYFELEIVLPSEQHLYDLLALQRNNPELFAQHITAWGSSVENFNRSVGYIDAAMAHAKAARDIRKAERKAKYMKIAAIVITIATQNPWIAEGSWLGSVWAVPTLTAAAQLAIYGELDIAQTALSFVTAGVGPGGWDITTISTDVVLQGIVDAVVSGVIRGVGSHLAGGEFEHGFFAGVVESVLNHEKVLPKGSNWFFRVVRAGVIQGIVAEISNEVGYDGNQLGFWGGFQRGALGALATEIGIAAFGAEGQVACSSSRMFCDLSILGEALNMIIEGADGLDVLNTLIQSGFAVYAFNQSVSNFIEKYSGTPAFILAVHLEENNGKFIADNDGGELSDLDKARNSLIEDAIDHAISVNGQVVDMSLDQIQQLFGGIATGYLLVTAGGGDIDDIGKLKGDELIKAFVALGVFDGSFGSKMSFLSPELQAQFTPELLESIRTAEWPVAANDKSGKTYKVRYVEDGKFEYQNEEGEVIGYAEVDGTGAIVSISLKNPDEKGNFDTSAFPPEIIALNDPTIFTDPVVVPAANGGPGSLTHYVGVDEQTGERIVVQIPGFTEGLQESIDGIVKFATDNDIETWDQLRDYLNDNQDQSVRLGTTDLGDGVIADVIEITMYGVGATNYAAAGIWKLAVPRNNLESALVITGFLATARNAVYKGLLKNAVNNNLKRIGDFQYAGRFGILPYKTLVQLKRPLGLGNNLHAHHLIEKRLAGVLNVKEGDMLSIALTPTEHIRFTNLWNSAIPRGTNYNTITPDYVYDVARDIYKDYPEIIKALGL